MQQQLRRDDEVEQHRAQQHGERHAQADDHARADQQHAGLEDQPGHLAVRERIQPLREVELPPGCAARAGASPARPAAGRVAAELFDQRAVGAQQSHQRRPPPAR